VSVIEAPSFLPGIEEDAAWFEARTRQAWQRNRIPWGRVVHGLVVARFHEPLPAAFGPDGERFGQVLFCRNR